MKFTKEFLKSSLKLRKDTVEDKLVDHDRWSMTKRRIFRHDGKFYETHYTVGATEYQEQRPYEGDDDEIECPEVFPVEKTIIVYEQAKAAS